MFMLFFFDHLAVFFHLFIGNLDRKVGHSEGQIEEKRFFFVLTDEVEPPVDKVILRVAFAFQAAVIARQGDFFTIFPQIFRVVVVGVDLAEETAEVIKTLFERISAGAFVTQSPFAVSGGGVVFLFQ